MMKTDESDSVWSSLREEVVKTADSETMLASYLHAAVKRSGRRQLPLPDGHG